LRIKRYLQHQVNQFTEKHAQAVGEALGTAANLTRETVNEAVRGVAQKVKQQTDAIGGLDPSQRKEVIEAAAKLIPFNIRLGIERTHVEDGPKKSLAELLDVAGDIGQTIQKQLDSPDMGPLPDDKKVGRDAAFKDRLGKGGEMWGNGEGAAKALNEAKRRQNERKAELKERARRADQEDAAFADQHLSTRWDIRAEQLRKQEEQGKERKQEIANDLIAFLKAAKGE
jgi:hypothetical protein